MALHKTKTPKQRLLTPLSPLLDIAFIADPFISFITLYPLYPLYPGSDFLGWVHFTDHAILRGTTRRRMMKKLKQNSSPETIASYRGLLAHGNARKLERKIDALVEKNKGQNPK